MLLVTFILFACATICLSLEAGINLKITNIIFFNKSNYIEPLRLSNNESHLAFLGMDLGWRITTQFCVCLTFVSLFTYLTAVTLGLDS